MHRAYNLLSPPPPLPRVQNFDYSRITIPKHPYLPPVLDPQADTVRIDDDSAQPYRPPGTETHAIERWKMMLYVRRLGGRVVGIEPRNECTPHYPSMRYYVTK